VLKKNAQETESKMVEAILEICSRSRPNLFARSNVPPHFCPVTRKMSRN
jgi:hypothetical protein